MDEPFDRTIILCGSSNTCANTQPNSCSTYAIANAIAVTGANTPPHASSNTNVLAWKISWDRVYPQRRV